MNNLTLKQDKFCQLYVSLCNASEAYRKSYNTGNMKSKTINEKASLLLKKDNIRTRVEELQKIESQKHHVTRDFIVKELKDVITKGKNDEVLDLSAINKSLDTLNKMFGFYAPIKQDVEVKMASKSFADLFKE